MTSPVGVDAPDAVKVLGRLGPDEGPALFVLYTGGTFGMGVDDDGSLVPLDLRELGAYLPFLRRLPLGLTVATFVDPIDSSAMDTSDWLDIADAIVAHAPGHAGVVVLHGTDTMAYTASALSFLLEGIATGAVSGGDMTFEAALTKLMALTERHPPDEVRRLMQEDLAGELSVRQPDDPQGVVIGHG